LEGLEARIASLPEVRENKDQRIDSDFWTKEPYRNPNLVYEPIRDHLVRSQYGVSISMNEDGNGVPIYRMNEIHHMMCDLDVDKYAELDAKQCKQFRLQPRDVLFNRTNSYEWVGRTGLYIGSKGETPVFASYLVRFQTQHRTLLPELMVAFLGSRYGVAEVKRRSRQSINQTNVNPEEVKEILIPILGMPVQENIAQVFSSAHSLLIDAEASMTQAETVLYSALGLANWTPPEPLSYTARASDVFSAARLDAQFFTPRVQALLDLLSVDGRTVRDVADHRREKFRSDNCAHFNYIEIGGLDGAGAATSTLLACSEAPSRATWYVRPDDIITSTVRPIRRLSAQIAPEQDGYVCSSGFVVVKPKDIAPEVLLTYLRLPVICELLDLYASASMYPAITDADIFNLPLPNISDEVAEEVTRNVQEAKAAKASAANMLDAAKRAVEIAIEDGEPAAMAFLDQAEEAI
jgi:hypothetical protein